jgi:hypothetical protein
LRIGHRDGLLSDPEHRLLSFPRNKSKPVERGAADGHGPSHHRRFKSINLKVL